jgi:hypothetical protein
MSGKTARETIAEKCRKKYAKGINLVVVDAEAVGETFCPNFCVDPGRIFLTYERLINEALQPKPDENEPFYKAIKNMIDEYDPFKEILFFVLKIRSEKTEGYVYKVTI